MENFKILFVDDDQMILEVVGEYLTRQAFDVITASSGTAALEALAQEEIDVVFTDLVMPEMGGLQLLKQIKSSYPSVEVIIVTGNATIESAVQALKLGSYDYLEKPIEFERLKALVSRLLEKQKLQDENRFIRQRLKERYKYDEMVGIGPKIQEIYNIIDRISMSDPTVLIQGESGTGKELVARIIHKNSNRKRKPFVPVNCGAISESLLESELFGHVKGAFTGAIRDNMGLFKSADGGTIFLDEIAEVPALTQVKLLRVLQEKRIRPVGDTREIPVDVRVIAATNKDLDQAIRNRTFRQDLFFRLNVISLKMPPLRETSEDIPFLINHFERKYGANSPTKRLNISPEAMDILLKYHWPGNVRELENMIERAFALRMDKAITAADLPQHMIHHRHVPEDEVTNLNLVDNEVDLIKKALLKTDGNKAEAAKLLGINITTVYRKMQKYNIADKVLKEAQA